jgi:hypothetical protein
MPRPVFERFMQQHYGMYGLNPGLAAERVTAIAEMRCAMNKPKDMQQRYLDALAIYQQEPQPWGADKLMIAICLAMLQDYATARETFRNTLDDFLNSVRKAWLITNQPNWLADTCVLADQPEFYEQAYRDIVEAYKARATRAAPVNVYARALLRLAIGEDAEALSYARGLFATPKLKDLYAAGQAVQAIMERDQTALDGALVVVLQAHRGMAKFGGLRETPEGYLCLPAMALAKVALDRGMAVNVESEYLSKGYLEYLKRAR